MGKCISKPVKPGAKVVSSNVRHTAEEGKKDDDASSSKQEDMDNTNTTEKDDAGSTKQEDMDDTNTTGVSTSQNTVENTNEGTGEKADSSQNIPVSATVKGLEVVSSCAKTANAVVKLTVPEPVAVIVGGALSFIPPVCALAKGLLKLLNTHKKNKEQCEKLAVRVGNLMVILNKLEQKKNQDNNNDLKKEVAALKKTLEAAEALMEEQKSPGHWKKIKGFFKADAIQDQLNELDETLKDHDNQLSRLLKLEQREVIGGLVEQVGTMQEDLEEINAMTSTLCGKVDNVERKLDEKLENFCEKVGKPTDGRSPTESQQALKKKLSEAFHNVRAVIPKSGKAVSLEKIYTELYITEGECEEVSTEHEVRQIEMASKKSETPIKHTDIFKPLPGQDKHIRTVMTKGVAGIGKTISVQKFILDWAEGDKNQDIHFLLPVAFRDINRVKDKKYNFKEFIHHFFSEISDLIFTTDVEYNIAFIFDGLDESRLPLDFENNEDIRNVSELATVDVLLTNLIKGNLLPSAQIWITSRPAAANQIPPDCVDQVTEVRGFTGEQKKDYFKKNVKDQEVASRIITHLERSRSLYIMCYIPVFCWMAARVLESILPEGKSDEISSSLTQMYIHFLNIQANISKKYKDWNQKTISKEYLNTVLSLGRLAFQQLEKGNLIFYEDDLRECGMDAEKASDYSGVCTQIFREESGLYQAKVFCFVHLSIQEFLAALYVFLCFNNKDRNTTDQHQTSQLSALFRAATIHDLHKTAVVLALQSKNGHLDLFLRFLLGLSLESSQNLLKDVLPKTSSQSQSSVQTVQCVKRKIRGESSNNRRINLFYCLNELNQHAVVEHIDRERRQLSVQMLLPGEGKTVRFELKMSEQQLDGFDLQKYIKTPEKDQTDLLSPDYVLKKLVPVVTTSTKAELRKCKLTDKSCRHLASVLSSPSSRLTCLDLTGNALLGDSGVELLCPGLQHQHCRLEKLKLGLCKLTGKSCSLLASVLSSPSSRIKWLILLANGLRASDVEQLSALKEDPNCRLEDLWYS